MATLCLSHHPKTDLRWGSWELLKHQADCSVGERSVHDVRVTRYPADVCCTPIHLAVFVIESVFVRHRRMKEIPACGVKHALRFAC